MVISRDRHTPPRPTQATGSSDRTVRVWDTESGATLDTLRGPASPPSKTQSTKTQSTAQSTKAQSTEHENTEQSTEHKKNAPLPLLALHC